MNIDISKLTQELSTYCGELNKSFVAVDRDERGSVPELSAAAVIISRLVLKNTTMALEKLNTIKTSYLPEIADLIPRRLDESEREAALSAHTKIAEIVDNLMKHLSPLEEMLEDSKNDLEMGMR